MTNPTHKLTFDTVVDENRTEEGVMKDGVLRTNHENRPDFEPQSDGSVDLHSANADVICESFGMNASIEEVP